MVGVIEGSIFGVLGGGRIVDVGFCCSVMGIGVMRVGGVKFLFCGRSVLLVLVFDF